MLEDKRLKIFATVVKFSNFTTAASSLGLSQPAVSQNIAELERLLGVQLFTRGRVSAELTPEGRKFAGYVGQILHWYKAAENAFGAGESDADAALSAEDSAVYAAPAAAGGNASGAEPHGKSSALLALDASTDAEIWSFGGDLHIQIKHK